MRSRRGSSNDKGRKLRNVRKFRVLIADQFSPTTHAFFNLKLLQLLMELPSIERITFIGHSRLVGKLKEPCKGKRVDFLEFDHFYEARLKSYRECRKYLFLRRKSLELNVTHIIFSSFENVSFAFLKHILPSKIPILCFLHYNIDDLLHRDILTRLVLAAGRKNVYFLAFEDFLLTQFTKLVPTSKDRVFVIPHPIETGRSSPSATKEVVFTDATKNSLTIFVPSGSSDSRVVEELHKSVHALGVQVKVYSKFPREVDLGWFVGKPYFSDEEYGRLLDLADVIYIPFSKDFGYRVSGPLFESIYRRKVVVTNRTPLTNYIWSRYPYTVYVVDNLPCRQDIFNAFAERRKHENEYEHSWEKFVDEHSDANIGERLYKLLELTFQGES